MATFVEINTNELPYDQLNKQSLSNIIEHRKNGMQISHYTKSAVFLTYAF